MIVDIATITRLFLFAIAMTSLSTWKASATIKLLKKPKKNDPAYFYKFLNL